MTTFVVQIILMIKIYCQATDVLIVNSTQFNLIQL